MAVKYKDLLGPFEELWGVLKYVESLRDTIKNDKKGHLKKCPIIIVFFILAPKNIPKVSQILLDI